MKEIKNLDTLMNGALTEQFNAELQRVMQNIYDPNTDPKKKRKLVMTVIITPHESRDAAEIETNVKSDLAPMKPHKQTIFISLNDDGSVHAFENNGQLPGQVDFSGNINQPAEVTLGTPLDGFVDMSQYRQKKEV